MATPMENLERQVGEIKGVANSAAALIRGFAAALKAAGTDQAKLTALHDDLDSTEQDLVLAVTENPLPGENPTPPTA